MITEDKIKTIILNSIIVILKSQEQFEEILKVGTQAPPRPAARRATFGDWGMAPTLVSVPWAADAPPGA